MSVCMSLNNCWLRKLLTENPYLSCLLTLYLHCSLSLFRSAAIRASSMPQQHSQPQQYSASGSGGSGSIAQGTSQRPPQRPPPPYTPVDPKVQHELHTRVTSYLYVFSHFYCELLPSCCD